MTCEVNGQIWKQSPCRQVPAPPTNSLVSAGGGCQRACVCVLCVCGRQAVIEEVPGGGGWRMENGGLTWVLEVLDEIWALCSAHFAHFACLPMK